MTRRQIKRLTGWAQKSKQVEWLRVNGVDHWVRADGYPSVPARVLSSIAAEPTRTRPNFEALRKAG